MPCDEMSANWAAQRIQGLNLGVAIMHAVTRALKTKHATRGTEGPVIKTLIESFQYPRKGPGMMWEAVARKIEQFGGKVLMGRELQRLTVW
jgi:protoporphyrinogen oxidase